MGCLGLILLLFITLPVFFILIFLNVVTISFSKLGLSPDAAFMLLFAILIGSTINLPISRRRIAYQSPRPPYMNFFFYRNNPAPVAYISGVMGTLIGADLLNWSNFKKLGSHVLSIGGAGVFDGIFLTGIVAALIA
jgi:uncharacterized membrane protein